MGGFNSGRPAWHATVESGVVLDLCRLIRAGSVVPGFYRGGGLTWTRTGTGERVASIGYAADITEPHAAVIRLTYTITRQGRAVEKDYQVWLTATQPHFGGRRWWFLCPVSGRRAGKLYLPPGGDVFASRAVYRLAYQSQRVSRIERTHGRQRRIYARLGVDYRCFEQGAPVRKKWMRRATYERLLGELAAAEVAHEHVFAAGASRLLIRETKLKRRAGRHGAS